MESLTTKLRSALLATSIVPAPPTLEPVVLVKTPL
jgi:hypothetical protein